jgi:hypothetical protein
MGRLTLNVLLSFAQFEREVTGERIRDKIAASKRKGVWMGGVPPLGYDVRERRIIINPAEAKPVRYTYERYLELGCVRQLSRELAERGIVSKVRISKKVIESGGCRFSRGALYELLSNPIHWGETVCLLKFVVEPYHSSLQHLTAFKRHGADRRCCTDFLIMRVEDARRTFSAVDCRENREANLVDQALAQKRAVRNAAAFE